MTSDELTEKLVYWAKQVNNYNDGCGCWMCLTKIKEGFDKVIDEEIKSRKEKYDKQIKES